MMFRSDFFATAYDDYVRALARDPADPAALDGFARSAIMARNSAEALDDLKKLTDGARRDAGRLHGPVEAARGHRRRRMPRWPPRSARRRSSPSRSRRSNRKPRWLQMLATRCSSASSSTRSTASHRNAAVTYYFEAVLRFLRGDAEGTVASAGRAIAADRAYAPTYDLLGAAHTKLGQSAAARDAFETSLRFNAHDSTAYTNLGVLALTDGNRALAAGYFAEALWLDPGSRTARQGLAQAQTGS